MQRKPLRQFAAITGRRGERIARRHLRKHGYRILAKRWRTPRG